MSKEKNKLKPIDTPVYRYWSALYMSFYSRRLYVDVGKRWRRLNIFYLLLVIALFSLPLVIRMELNLSDAFRERILGPLTKIPVFYIQDGNASFDKPMPYLVKNDKGQVVAIVDTTGKINDFSQKYPYATILINKNKISFRTPNIQIFNMDESVPTTGAPVVQEFDKGINLVFDGKQIAEENSIRNLKYFSQLLIYPIVVGLFFSLFLVFFLVFGFLGQVFSTVFFSFNVTFLQSSRLLIVAGTPMLLFLMLMLAFNAIFKGSGFVLFFLIIGYYSFALHAFRAESRQVVIS